MNQGDPQSSDLILSPDERFLSRQSGGRGSWQTRGGNHSESEERGCKAGGALFEGGPARGMVPSLLSRPEITSLVTSDRAIQTNRELSSIHGKRRSLWFYLAQNRFKSIADMGFLPYSAVEQEKLGQLEIYYDNWRAGYMNRFVHLEKGNRHLFIRQYSRFDSNYRFKLRKKLAKLDGVLWDLKIELTIDPKKTMRLSDGFSLLTKGWNRLNSWLKRRFGEFETFQCREIQKSGRLHLHVLLSGVRWIEQGELSDLWDSYGCGPIVYIKRVHSRNNVRMSAYVMKYVNKSLKSENKRYSALLFASNKRLFSMNQACQKTIRVDQKEREKQGYSYSGTVPEASLIHYCDERAVNLAPFMVLTVEREDLYEFPEIFGGEGG